MDGKGCDATFGLEVQHSRVGRMRESRVGESLGGCVLGFRVSGFGFRVSGFGFRVSGTRLAEHVL